MGYRPTLGGLRKVQALLNASGRPLPIFQMEIFSDGYFNGFRWTPGKGVTVSINEAIQEYGAMHEVINVQLTNEQGDKFVRIVSSIYTDLIGGFCALLNECDVVLESNIDAVRCPELVNLARWGKTEPTLFDKFIFRFFPRYYAAKIFGSHV